ncbi:CDP-diacylglycerol--glycerol-3-phosphate 3-phosphatidyltransferase [Hyphococcus sp.]|uniref:CDP-diacylglycerol--glycerol-3-phosphate 3-phosphatidyltransferase n=1 Tax=Hyphococcus sp. TaxID=2038636 RepID=UPI00208CFD76|nr:MAG: CDP-diacylglycerol--glycerol-3-phosphate 3-phosphatidyltransferase [Marinicaulis sp.]
MANLITLARMALVIPFVFAFLADAIWNMNVALVIFTIAALTDFVDGRVARARGETSALGAALDPIADKLLIAAAFILLVRNGVVTGAGVVAVIIIILRELLVSGLREALSMSQRALDVTALAKWKTTAQLIAAGLLIAAAPTGLAGEPLRPVASAALWIAAMMTLWTGAEYSMRAAELLRTNRS